MGVTLPNGFTVIAFTLDNAKNPHPSPLPEYRERGKRGNAIALSSASMGGFILPINGWFPIESARSMDSAESRLKPMCLREDALGVLMHLRKSGHTAYFAGGCVRDQLLGLEAKDWDVATDAEPGRVRELFPSTQAVGAAFGVILVRSGKSVVEVATFRADGVYEDGRRPSSVRFTSAEEDARRRDFTINGLFLDPVKNEVIDFVGGREDLKAKKIRAIGTPAERFGEDHLRLLRAVRFAARFGFEIESTTAEAIRGLASRIKQISPERVGDELRLMLMAATRGNAWKQLWDLGLGPEVFRFLTKVPEQMDAARSIFLNVAEGEAISFGLSLAAAALCARLQADSVADVLPLLSKAEISRSARTMRQALRTSNEEEDEMTEILTSLEPLLQTAEPTLAQKKRFLARATSGKARLLLDALALVGISKARIEKLRPEWAELSQGDMAPVALVTGDDLTAAGFQPGPEYRRILDAVYDAQLEGRVAGKEDAMKLARQLKTQ
jgi:poly(A) polymerase